MANPMTKTKALELLTVALREQRHLYTYRFVLEDVARHLEHYERKEASEDETIKRIATSLNVYRYEMKGE